MAESKILYGGQAVIEGVMMRGRNFVSCAVRRENGEIALKSESIPKGVYSGVWSKTPFLRALPLLWDTLVLGTRMLMWAANVQVADESAKDKQPAGKVETDSEVLLENEALTEAVTAGASGAVQGAAMMQEPMVEARPPAPTVSAVQTEPEAMLEARSPAPTVSAVQPELEPEGMPQTAIYGTLALSLGLGILVFFALPVVVANFAGDLGMPALWNNILEGAIRLGLFLAYLLAIGWIPEIQRVFMYHGAEHKTIAAYEGGGEFGSGGGAEIFERASPLWDGLFVDGGGHLDHFFYRAG